MAPPRLRSRLRRLAARAIGSPSHAPEDRSPPRAEPEPAPLAGLPPLQPGRGETPGPNHKQDISQEWASAQLHSGVPPCFLDLRPSHEYTNARIPGSLSMPAWAVRERTDELPEKDERIAVYDADGAQQSAAVAAWLRDQGWQGARRLQGGFQAWSAGGDAVEVEPDPQA